jgi:hypothetical protein
MAGFWLGNVPQSAKFSSQNWIWSSQESIMINSFSSSSLSSKVYLTSAGCTNYDEWTTWTTDNLSGFSSSTETLTQTSFALECEN